MEAPHWDLLFELHVGWSAIVPEVHWRNGNNAIVAAISFPEARRTTRG